MTGGRLALREVTLRGNPDQQTDHVVPLERVVSGAARGEPHVYVGEVGDGSGGRAENQVISTGMAHAEMIAFPVTLLIWWERSARWSPRWSHCCWG